MSDDNNGAPFAFPGLDRLFHERARLGIVTSLAGHRAGLAFAELKRLCALTDGNLNRHLGTLEDAGYVTMVKQPVGRRTQTMCRLTELGREHFAAYLGSLEAALREGARAAEAGRSLEEPG